MVYLTFLAKKNTFFEGPLFPMKASSEATLLLFVLGPKNRVPVGF